LIVALLIVAGAAASAPPSGRSASGDHFGLLLHPLFPHAHGLSRAMPPWSDEERSAADPGGAKTVDQAPGISAGTSEAGARDALAGMLLPLLLAAAAIELTRRRPSTERAPAQRALAPPTPPPRPSASVA
jgi:hypothetical protein